MTVKVTRREPNTQQPTRIEAEGERITIDYADDDDRVILVHIGRAWFRIELSSYDGTYDGAYPEIVEGKK